SGGSWMTGPLVDGKGSEWIEGRTQGWDSCCAGAEQSSGRGAAEEGLKMGSGGVAEGFGLRPDDGAITDLYVNEELIGKGEAL
ncbi:hypothetical protein HK101_009451, partial [Irineochytrium annulatum]